VDERTLGALAGAVVVVAAPSSPITGIDVVTGRTKWTANLRGRVVAGGADAVVVEVAGPGNAAKTVVLDPATGRVRWQVAGLGAVTITPSGVLLSQYEGTSGGTIAYDPSDGHVLWSDSLAVASNSDNPTLLIVGNVAVGATAGRAGGPPNVTAVDLANGQVLWNTAAANAIQAGDGNLYVVAGLKLTALDARTSKPRWSVPARTDLSVAGAGIVLLLDDRAVDAATGRDRWTFGTSPQHTAFDRWRNAGVQTQTYATNPGRLYLGFYDCGLGD
jgi:outer membrane protein assembly factor BamB